MHMRTVADKGPKASSGSSGFNGSSVEMPRASCTSPARRRSRVGVAAVAAGAGRVKGSPEPKPASTRAAYVEMHSTGSSLDCDIYQ